MGTDRRQTDGQTKWDVESRSTRLNSEVSFDKIGFPLHLVFFCRGAKPFSWIIYSHDSADNFLRFYKFGNVIPWRILYYISTGC